MDALYHTRVAIIRSLKQAAALGSNDGSLSNAAYPQKYRAVVHYAGLATSIIFSRDTVQHTSGWWKNPDYERCFHLSLGYFESSTMKPVAANQKESKIWIDIAFPDMQQYIWLESPITEEGKSAGVYHHYRVFCGPLWNPIIPRIYSKDFPPAGWKLYSDVQYDIVKKNTTEQTFVKL